LPQGREQGLQALIPDKRHAGRRSMQRAALVALLLTAAAFSGVLAGCSGLAETGGDIAPTAPDPTFREVIAIHLKAVFKNYASYDAFEISDPRWVHSIKGWNWLTCVRFQDHGHLRIYALFLNANKIVDERYAVQTDNCDTQTYFPFERMQTGLEPLH
jgi:hypothetical protein